MGIELCSSFFAEGSPASSPIWIRRMAPLCRIIAYARLWWWPWAPGASHCNGPTSGTVLARFPPQKAFSLFPARDILLISSILKDKAKRLWSRRRPTIRPPSRAAALPTAGDRRSPLLSYCWNDTVFAPSLKEDDNLWGIASHRIDVPYLWGCYRGRGS